MKAILFIFFTIFLTFNCNSQSANFKDIKIKIKKNKSYENQDYVVFDVSILNKMNNELMFLLDYKYNFNGVLFGYSDSIAKDTLIICLFNKTYSAKYKNCQPPNFSDYCSGDLSTVESYYYSTLNIFKLNKNQKKNINIMVKKNCLIGINYVKVVFFFKEDSTDSSSNYKEIYRYFKFF